MPPPPPLTSAQIRAARALIRWSAEDLADHRAVSVTTIRRAELMPSTTALAQGERFTSSARPSKRPGSNSSMPIKAGQECG